MSQKVAVPLKYYIESTRKLGNFGRLKLPLYRRNGKICEAFLRELSLYRDKHYIGGLYIFFCLNTMQKLLLH